MIDSAIRSALSEHRLSWNVVVMRHSSSLYKCLIERYYTSIKRIFRCLFRSMLGNFVFWFFLLFISLLKMVLKVLKWRC